jgi:hypothetical protein
MSAADAVERFLATGEHDPHFSDWEGDVVERRRAGTSVLREVLTKITRWRAQRAPIRSVTVPADAEARIRARIEPMLRGLFGAETEPLLDRLPTRVVVVTPATFAALPPEVPLRTAWDLANVMLDDMGAPPLSDDTPALDGLCAAGRAWVLPRALVSDAPFPDIVTHEVAHLLHTLSRADLGLDGPAGPILAIPPRRRETFAYACEVWAGATRAGGSRAVVARNVADWRASSEAVDVRVDRAELDPLLDAALADPLRGWATLRAWVDRVSAQRRTPARVA